LYVRCTAEAGRGLRRWAFAQSEREPGRDRVEVPRSFESALPFSGDPGGDLGAEA
jgi:hypothetical protein